MPPLQERHSRRFHLTLQVCQLEQSIAEYSKILGQRPCCVIPGHLALWRTAELNFLLRTSTKPRVAVLQLGWEYDYLEGNQRLRDCNQLSWLLFSTAKQDEAIKRFPAASKYDEDSDFLLELRNPSVHWKPWLTALLLLGMAAFTLWNHQLLRNFFRPAPPEVLLASSSSLTTQLQRVGLLLEQAGYQLHYYEQYAVARHPRQARITLQIVDQQLLFTTYWGLQQQYSNSQDQPGRNLLSQINQINREAVLCRYYLDEDHDLAVEAWLPLPAFLTEPPREAQTTPALQAAQAAQAAPTGAADKQVELLRRQAQRQWQKTLALWQLESLSWIQNSPLFGGVAMLARERSKEPAEEKS